MIRSQSCNRTLRTVRARTPVAKLKTLELTILPHPAYSPDLAPFNYYLFPQLKKYLKIHHYNNDEEVIADVRIWCRRQSSEFFDDGVHQLVKSQRLCVDCDGDYVKKQSAKYVAEILSFRLTYCLYICCEKLKSYD
ncbi:histone-lysine N-methyltransferase SETMAR [Elysia marginata]|uniref:Histone-lysine N-methyltransferase SETMAR n=1 Tax=Elysia marginata TaxID=1093978 RepID=A0AAV4EFY5_9GAST|nr:histone-lysine N-methyltransferase SETMAR [Elysia marginata]